MVGQITIRRAAHSDAVAISSLIRGLSHHRTVGPTGPARQNFLALFAPKAIESYISDPNNNYLVAEVDSDLVGVLAIRDNSCLFHLFVATPFQRPGIARTLWNRAKAESLSAGNTDEFTVRSSVYAIPVYEHFGFEVTGPRVEGDGVTYVPMRLVLSNNHG